MLLLNQGGLYSRPTGLQDHLYNRPGYKLSCSTSATIERSNRGNHNNKPTPIVIS